MNKPKPFQGKRKGSFKVNYSKTKLAILYGSSSMSSFPPEPSDDASWLSDTQKIDHTPLLLLPCNYQMIATSHVLAQLGVWEQKSNRVRESPSLRQISKKS